MNRAIRNKMLVQYLKSHGIIGSQKELGRKMGYDNESYFSQIMTEKVETPKGFINNLKSLAPELNCDWLLTGEGEMLKTSTVSLSGVNQTGDGSNTIVAGAGAQNVAAAADMEGITKMFKEMMDKKDQQIDRLHGMIETLLKERGKGGE